jgi:hypothetical protein
MSVGERLKEEGTKVAVTTLFFAACFLAMMGFKALVLAEYRIAFFDLSAALIGALIVAKVVLILENVPIGGWVERRPAVVHVLVRTFLYGIGVLVVLLLEKAFEARHEYGGFTNALTEVFEHRDIRHVWATAAGVTTTLLLFNALFVLRRHIGGYGLLSMFTAPLPQERLAESLEIEGALDRANIFPISRTPKH